MYKSLILFLLLGITSCTGYFSEISINSNLQQGDSLSVSLHFIAQRQYIPVNGVAVSVTDEQRGRVDIPLPDSLIRNVAAIALTIHRCSDSVFSISSIQLNRRATICYEEIMNALWWQTGLSFQPDVESNTLNSRIDKGVEATFVIGMDSFYRPHFKGFQRFFRFSFLVVLLLLLVIFCRKIPFRHLPFWGIALFLAALPLKSAYTDWTMGIMALAAVVTFIVWKPRIFHWQPVFYALCAAYLINVVGLLYTGDMYLGKKRLDSNIPLILFPLIFSMIRYSRENVLLILRFFVWTVIVFCGFGLLSYAAIIPEFTWDVAFRDSKQYAMLMVMWPAHGHVSFDSTILLMAMPAALFLRFHDKPQISVVEMLAGILLPVAFTVLTGARVGIVIIPFLLGLSYLFYCRLKPLFKWSLAGVGMIAVLYGIWRFPQADDRFEDPIRENLRTLAVDAIKEKPLFGWGTGYVLPLIQAEETTQRLGIEKPYPFGQFHNQYLEDMVQFGVPGALLLLLLVGWLFFLAVRNKDYLMFSLLVVYLLFFWTETTLANAKGVVPFAFWVCFLAATQNVRQAPDKKSFDN